MKNLLIDDDVEIIYQPGKGAWTYHIKIPNSKHIVGKWGSIKVSGFIDDYRIEMKNLFTIGGQDKMMAINAAIRKAIKKGAGDKVRASLFLIDFIKD